MGYQKRKALIEKIQEKRGSKVLTYFLGDREVVPPGMAIPFVRLNIGQDAKIPIYEALKVLGPQEKLDLFIYTRGGAVEAVWPIVNLIREFCKQFHVLVSYRCHSAGTSICLGADKIVMSKMGELSPIDPTTGNPFNPMDEIAKGQRKGISVEDVTSYLRLAKDPKKFNLQDNGILDVFKELTRKVEPLALGNVNRVYTQIRLLAKKLLSLHLDDEAENERIEKIINALTEESYSHLHFMNRKEAKEIIGEDIIETPDETLEGLMMELFDSYADLLELRQSFSVFSEMQGLNHKNFDITVAAIENDSTSYVFNTSFSLYQRSELPPNIQVTLQPGQVVLPVIAGLPKSFQVELLALGWDKNRKEV